MEELLAGHDLIIHRLLALPVPDTMKDGRDGRYLSVKELKQLFRERTLPARMLGRLAAA